MANISLAEALLAGGSGLFKGLNANREKREADKRYEDQVAYQRSRQAVEDQYNKLRLDNEKIKNDAYSKSVGNQATPEERKNSLDARLKSDAAGRDLRKYLGLLGSYTTLKASLGSQKGMTERQRADILASQGREVGTMARSIASRMSDLQQGLDFLSPEEQAKAIDEINSLREQKDALESQVPELFQKATGVLDQYDPGTAPPMPVAPGDGDGPDVEGATEDAIETPAPSGGVSPAAPQMMYRFGTGIPIPQQTVGQALQPQAAPPQQTLGAAMAPSDTAGVPREVLLGIIQAATKLRPEQAAGYVKAQLAKYKAQTGAR